VAKRGEERECEKGGEGRGAETGLKVRGLERERERPSIGN
jgi:hypothetical protein